MCLHLSVADRLPYRKRACLGSFQSAACRMGPRFTQVEFCQETAQNIAEIERDILLGFSRKKRGYYGVFTGRFAERFGFLHL